MSSNPEIFICSLFLCELRVGDTDPVESAIRAAASQALAAARSFSRCAEAGKGSETAAGFHRLHFFRIFSAEKV